MSRNKEYKMLINSYTWVTLRRVYLMHHPLCERCLAEGRTRAAEEVHHVVPIESVKDLPTMRRLAYDINNLQALCRDCHHAAHASSNRGGAMRAEKEIKNFVKKFLE